MRRYIFLSLLVMLCSLFNVPHVDGASAILDGNFREVFRDGENTWYVDMDRIRPVDDYQIWEVYLKREYLSGEMTELYQLFVRQNPQAFKYLDSYAFDSSGDLVDQ